MVVSPVFLTGRGTYPIGKVSGDALAADTDLLDPQLALCALLSGSFIDRNRIEEFVNC